MSHRLLFGIALTASLAAHQSHAAEAETPASPAPNDGLVAVFGRVLRPDGSPAPDATVRARSNNGVPGPAAKTDGQGRFVLHDLFGNGCRLHACAADDSLQATRFIASGDVRATTDEPVDLTLSPAKRRIINVSLGGQAAPDVHIAARGQDFVVHTMTNFDGVATLWIPDPDKLTELAAWHPVLGCAALVDRSAGLDQSTISLDLLPTARHTIRVRDLDDRPVANLPMGISVSGGDAFPWVVLRDIEAAQVRTDADGEVVLEWAPSQPKYVNVDFLGRGWKVDDYENSQTPEGVTVVQVRRKLPVRGRLAMPDGQSAEGVLITGFGFGPKSHGDIPYARARRDGSFDLEIPSDHGYALDIVDRAWASQGWSGCILAHDDAQPAEISLDVYPAREAVARVTRGPSRTPVADAWVELSNDQDFEWTDAGGELRSASAGIGTWLRTDRDGVVRAGVGRGVHEFRLSAGDWNETREFDVTSSELVPVDFHRPWAGKRRMTGQLLHEGEPYRVSSGVKTWAWARTSEYSSIEIPLVLRDDGGFEVAVDAETISIMVLDAPRQLAAFVELGTDQSDVSAPLEPAATYSGSLGEEKGEPAANRSVRLTTNYGDLVVAECKTDAAGAFRFEAVPCRVPLELRIEASADGRPFFARRDRVILAPGENRSAPPLELEVYDETGSPLRVPPPPVPLAESLPLKVRDANLAGMRVLVILQGDGEPATLAMSNRTVNYRENPDILGYMVIVVAAGDLANESQTLAEHQLQLPSEGELRVIVLDHDGSALDSLAASVENESEADRSIAEFVSNHAPPRRDAAQLLAAARDEAEHAGKRILLIEGGPRCGPCFRLARWMDDQHDLLEKDFVIVKIQSGRDLNAEATVGQLSPVTAGIPWWAITEPGGMVLATSDGPRGNVGFPTTAEDQRHVRSMLEATVRHMTPAEIDRVVESIVP